METSRYSKLQEASKASQQYESDCRNFILGLRQSLISYLGCPPDRIEWLRFTESESVEQLRANQVKELTFDRLMALQYDTNYQFCFRVNFDTAPIRLYGRVRLWEDHFHLCIAKESFKFEKDGVADMQHVLKHLERSIEECFKPGSSNFANEKSSTFGFDVNSQ